MHLILGWCPLFRGTSFSLEREVGASRSGRTQPLAFVITATRTIVVMVVIHLHMATLCTPIGTTGTAGELDLLIQLDSFLDIDLFHSDFPFKVNISRNFLPVISYYVRKQFTRVHETEKSKYFWEHYEKAIK